MKDSELRETSEVADAPVSGAIDPLILDAVKDVDGTLLDWALSLTPRERLRACSRAEIALRRFARAPSDER